MCYDYNVEVEEMFGEDITWAEWEECWADEESDEDFGDYPGDCDDWDIEMGFDPYEGCYTWDC